MANDSKALKKVEVPGLTLRDLIEEQSFKSGELLRRSIEGQMQRERKFEVVELDNVVTGYETLLNSVEEKFRFIEVRGNTAYFARHGKIIRLSVELMGEDDGCESVSQASCLMLRGGK